MHVSHQLVSKTLVLLCVCDGIADPSPVRRISFRNPDFRLVCDVVYDALISRCFDFMMLLVCCYESDMVGLANVIGLNCHGC